MRFCEEQPDESHELQRSPPQSRSSRNYINISDQHVWLCGSIWRESLPAPRCRRIESRLLSVGLRTLLGVQTRIRDDPALDGDVHQANKLSGVRSLAAGFGELDSFHTCRARYLRISAAAYLKVSLHQSSRPTHRPI